MVEQIIERLSFQDIALIWGTLRNNIDFRLIDKSFDIMIVDSINGRFPVDAYNDIYLEIPRNQMKMDLSGRRNNFSRKNQNNLWNSLRIFQLPVYYIENIESDVLIASFKQLINGWNDSHIPKEIPCIALALKVSGDYCDEREAQFIRILLIWENGTARFVDLEYYEGPLEDCISPEWYVKVSELGNYSNLGLKFKNLSRYLPNWNNQRFSLFIIPSFLGDYLKYGTHEEIDIYGWKRGYVYRTQDDLQKDINIILNKVNFFFKN
ncbi:hypothetical protein [Candidatus Harpocratesius sp.]